MREREKETEGQWESSSVSNSPSLGCFFQLQVKRSLVEKEQVKKSQNEGESKYSLVDQAYYYVNGKQRTSDLR